MKDRWHPWRTFPCESTNEETTCAIVPLRETPRRDTEPRKTTVVRNHLPPECVRHRTNRGGCKATDDGSPIDAGPAERARRIFGACGRHRVGGGASPSEPLSRCVEGHHQERGHVALHNSMRRHTFALRALLSVTYEFERSRD